METSLSDLPEDLISHIFSYIELNNCTAIGLSLLSKCLLHLVQRRPRLVFDSTKVRHKSDAESVRNYRKELEYVHSTLDRYHRENITLETFTLKADHMDVTQEELHDRCIESAAKNGPGNLILSMTSSEYVIPQCVFELESLVELTLGNCCLMPESTIAWPNLKRLNIEFKCKADEDAFGKITRACPFIEYLNVNSRSFTGFNFKVSHLPNLKELNFVLGLDQLLEVNAAPNLESMQCSSSKEHDKYFLGFGGTKYPMLTSLKVTTGEFSDNIFIKFARRFPILEKLHLEDCGSLRRIDLSSTSLKEIKLVNNSALREACFDVPNLVHFEYKNHDACLPKLKFVGSSSTWSSCIDLIERKNVNTSWFMELNEFLAALNMSETSISVQFLGKRATFNEAHPATAKAVIPVSGIRDFSIDTSWRDDRLSSVSAILDGIFAICQPRTITFLFCSNHKIPQLLYKKLVSKKSRNYRAVTDFEMFEGSEEECSRSAKRVKVEWDKFQEVLDEKKTKNISFQLKYCS